MSYSELLHRYFDEGLEEPLEDVLFERLAADADLRREFNEHLKIHSFVSQDVTNISTPASVTAALFTSLGLQVTAASKLPADIPNAGVMQRMKTALAASVPYFTTAVMTSLLTAGLMYLLFWTTPVEISSQSGPLPESVPGTTTAVAPQTEPTVLFTPTGPGYRGSTKSSVSSAAISGASQMETENGRPGLFAWDSSEYTPVRTATVARAEGLVETKPVADLETETRHSQPQDPEPVIALVEEVPAQTEFFFYSPSSNILSNIVVEMRMMNSRSTPDVDLPYDSPDLFKDIAISAIYKVSDYHAIGFEYGRETFGQEYSSVEETRSKQENAFIQRVYDPPQTWLPGVFRRNTMMDWYGLVWKTSFPEFGFLNFVYPYARTLLGKSMEGYIGKFRFGFEIFPTSYTSLNVGWEGTLLKYQIEEVWYQTNKMGWTAGVAIGF